MKGRYGQAKTLTEDEKIRSRVQATKVGNHPLSGLGMMLLSQEAGLRAGEIAQLEISAFLDPSGRFTGDVTVPNRITKGGRGGRSIPLTNEAKLVFQALVRRYVDFGYVSISPASPKNAPARMSAGAVTKWITRVYARAGLKGCSSHSGRRTFATQLASRLGSVGANLADLQILMGHASLASTLSYIDASGRAEALIGQLEKRSEQGSMD